MVDIGFIAVQAEKSSGIMDKSAKIYQPEELPEMIFGMLGLKFKGEEYLSPIAPKKGKSVGGKIKIALKIGPEKNGR